MAKNNQNDPLETIFSYIIVFLIVVVALVAGSVLIAYVAAPLIFLILYLINQIAYLASDRKRKRNFFWLTYDERELFKSRWEDFVAALKMKEYVEVAVEREGIQLNQNGQISVRSYRGKELRSKLDDANYVIKNASPLLDELQNKPRKQRKKCRKHYSNAFAFGLSLLALFYIVYDTLNTLNVSQIIEKIKLNQSDEAGGAMIVGVFVMLLTYVVVKLIFWVIFSIRFRKPPVVTIENVDTYIDYMQEKMRWKRKTKSHKTEKSEVSEIESNILPCAGEDGNNVEEEKPAMIVSEKSYEESMFRNWAVALEKEGYSLLGNWSNWAESGQWKNLSVPVSLLGTKIRAAIEYDAGENAIYFGIAKYDDEDRVSQSLLSNGTFTQIMKANGLSVKNNEWWYCLKYASFDNVFAQYCKLIGDIRNNQ